MGCVSSKDTQNIDQNQNSVDHDPSDRVGLQRGKTDGVNFDSKIDSPSSIELVQDDPHFERLTNEPDTNVGRIKRTPVKQKKRSSIDSGVASDAWTIGKTRTTGDQQLNMTNDNVESDSEFGREGIDFYSSSFNGIRTKSGETKPLPRSIQTEVQRHEKDGVPRLTKKYSEEPFDPSSLIDVDKFKAVNAPNQDTNGTVTMETRTTAAQSGPTTCTIVSPSNYHEFYDEDEKALMESIEQDFTGTAYSTLPGVVA